MPETSQPRPGRTCACHTIEDLNFSEQIALWSIRNWLTGGKRWSRCQDELHRVFGDEDGAKLGLALDCLMWVLNRCGLRTLRFGGLHCTRLWPDELGLLAVLDLAQQGERDIPARLLADILPATAARVAADYAGAAGAAMARNGYSLQRDVPADRSSPQDAPDFLLN